MRVILFSAGLALVGLGATILFGTPQKVVSGFRYWPEAGVALVLVGIVLMVIAGTAWLRHRKFVAAQDAASDLVTRTEVDATIASILSEVQKHEQWRVNAASYGDDTRAHALEAELATLRAQLADANRRLETLPKGPRTGLRLTVAQTQDRLTFINDTGQNIGVGEIMGEGGLNVTGRHAPPFVLPAGGTFFVNLHRMMASTESPMVVISLTDARGDRHVQRIGV
ncbi:hypothetical protein [Microbacterium maritypicum]